VRLGDVFDGLFLLPFLNGLVLAILLPLLGAWIRLREEWLAALGFAQVSAAGVVVGAIFVDRPVLAAFPAAALAGAVKSAVGRLGNDSYAIMILLGWSASLIGVSVSAQGDELGRALVQGQIYFTRGSHLATALVLALASAALLPWLSPRLLLGRFFPDYFRANGVRPKHDVLFDVLVALILALAATVVGVMAAFALVFVPPWIAFRFAHGWRRALAWSVGLGLVAYLVSFVAAIRLDQPFGPVLVAALLAVALTRPFVRA
jgi:zinc transport system permease protein